MKTIYHAMILSPLLFALGCAVTADDAQESTSQTDDSLSSVGGVPDPNPTIPPLMSLDSAGAISVRCTWNRNTTSATFDSNGAIFSTTPGVFALLISVGRLSMHAGGSLQCNWSTGAQTNLTLQGSDGNFVFYNQANGKTWAAHTRKADNPNGPGATATFQSDANLVVRNAAGNAIWASNSHTFPHARLAFQSDGNLVIYSNDGSDPVPWATGTE